MLFVKIRARRREYQARLLNFAVDRRILPGSSRYTKFIVLGRSRSGSNYLVDLLNSHRNIRCYSELFSRSGETYWDLPGYGAKKYRSKDIRQLKENDPAGFLARYIYRDVPTGTSAVGFKLFYNQAHKGNTKKLWSYLRELDDLKVIHLKRENILKVIVSKRTAETSSAWVKRGSQREIAQGAVELSYEDCLKQFQKTRSWQKEYDEYFSSKDKIDVIYEELAADAENVMNTVQEFLGVESRPLTAETRKQSSNPVSELISNYSQLKDQFMGTEWESMFE